MTAGPRSEGPRAPARREDAAVAWLLPAALVLVDALSTAGAIRLAFAVRFEWPATRLPIEEALAWAGLAVPDAPTWERYGRATPWCVLFVLATFAALRLYRRGPYAAELGSPWVVLRGSVAAWILLLPVTFFDRTFEYSRSMGPLAVLFLAAGSLAGRRVLLSALSGARRRGRCVIRCAILGDGERARRVAAHLGGDADGARRLVGRIGKDAGCPWESLDDALGADDVDEVVVALVQPSRDLLERVVRACDAHLKSFVVVPDVHDFLLSRMEIEHLGDIPLLSIQASPLHGWSALLKRAFDVVVGSAALAVSAPLMLLIAVGVRLDSPGPVIFRQQRVSLDGRVFTLLKFRSMFVAGEEDAPRWADDDDVRCTRLGRLLRAWSLDELPQLWNVVRGDMSLVGPRPEMAGMVERFRDSIPRYMSRHRVRSGMTGWAQIHGLRGNTSLSERLQHDLHYIQSWSLWLDVTILLRTVLRLHHPH